MAQPQENISLRAPGFWGLNTMDSPLDLELQYASLADNCVIDKLGRVGSRKGFKGLTEDFSTILGTNPIESMGEHVDQTGVSYFFVCGKDAAGVHSIWIQSELSPYGLTKMTMTPAPTGSNWAIASLGNKCYFAQKDHELRVFDPLVSTTEISVFTEGASDPVGDALTPPDKPNILISAVGHLWAADVNGDNQSLFISSLVTTGGGVDIYWESRYDIAHYWPSGSDAITALVFHNNFLIIFGKRSTLVYSVPPSGPSEMALVDTLSNIGCVGRDATTIVGKDVFFLDDTGLRSFGRTIQEKSLPVGDISINVQSDIQSLIVASDTKRIKMIYSPEESMAIVSFPTVYTSYVFDTRRPLETGALRTTRWPNRSLNSLYRTTRGLLYMGSTEGVFSYIGADDISTSTGATPVTMKYFTHPQSFGKPVNLKFPKQIDMVLFGSTTLDLDVEWAFDFSTVYNKFSFLAQGTTPPSYYNTTGSEYNTEGVEYSGSGTGLNNKRVNLWGSGTNVAFGFTALVTGSTLSFQELNIQALLGRIM